MAGTPPRVGVTRWEEVPGERIEDYWARIAAAGGEPVDLHDPNRFPDLDALVLTGGADVGPARFGEARHEKVRNVDAARDAWELELLARALHRDIPVLGICRGHQIINVAFGGRLLQHIEDRTHWADSRREGYPSGWHPLRIEPETRLHAVFGVDTIEVNSRHHQGITREALAPGLIVSATTPDGLVEALESRGHRWAVGVQWHPERSEPERPAFASAMAALFASFVEEAAKVVQP